MATTPPPDQKTLPEVLGHAAGIICSEHFPTGDRARLRRLTPGQPLPLAFSRFALAHLPEDWERRSDDWATITTGIAIMAPHAHQPHYGLGKALAEAGYSEARLERLLAADSETQQTLLLRAARFLAAKGKPCDWVDGALLLLTSDARKREQLHLRIARDYFYNLKSDTPSA